MSEEKVRQYEHLEGLIGMYPGAILKVWCNQDGYFEGEVEVDDIALIGIDSEFSVEELLEDLENNATDYLLKEDKQVALAAEAEAITTGQARWHDGQGFSDIPF